MTFRYKLSPRPPRQPINRLRRVTESEELTGFVKGREASDLEERFARAMDKARRDYMFQWFARTSFSIPGQDKQIDFMDTTEVWQPIEIDGTFTHKTGAQRAKDRSRDAILNLEFQKRGILPIVRIIGEEIETPDQADAIVRRLFGG